MKKKNAPTKPATPARRKASAELRSTALFGGNPEYECVMVNPPKPKILKSETWTIKGHNARLPSTQLFITEDWSVYLQTKRRGEKVEYTSLDSLIADLVHVLKNTLIIRNYSGDDLPPNAKLTDGPAENPKL